MTLDEDALALIAYSTLQRVLGGTPEVEDIDVNRGRADQVDPRHTWMPV
jgi:hypothetical protein